MSAQCPVCPKADTAGRFYEYTSFFCNGPGDVKSPRVIVTPPSSRFCPWSAPRPPYHLIPGSRDSAGDIFFTRLILLRCQPEQRSYRLRLRDPARIVHRRLEGNCHHRTNARHCHQPSADRVFTNNREHSLVQFLVLRLQSG